MRRLAVSCSIWFLCLVLGALAMLLLPNSSTAQTNATPVPDTRGLKDFATTGQLTVQVQDSTGQPFFEGAAVKLFTTDIATTLSTTSDQRGHALFTALPVGQYFIEISAPGYRKVQQQALISSTARAQSIMVSMIPSTVDSKVKIGSLSVSPKAIKESERALHALQLNRIDEAQQHLARALAFDPNFADGNYLMGLVLVRRKQPETAAAYLQKSLSLSPGHAASLLALGEAQYLNHDYSHATASLARFVLDQPHSPQAPLAQKYMDAMRRLRPANAGGDAASNSLSLVSDDVHARAAASNDDLAPLADLSATETNWAPSDVDSEKLDLDSASRCQLNEVIQSTALRVQELVQKVDRFTATEDVEHLNVSPMGLQISRETRKFAYIVEIHQIGKDLDVQEYRNGSVATAEFPGNIATVGLPTLALIFHRSLQPRYEFQCEGRGSWQGKPAWILHFQQRADEANGMLVYHVGSRFVSVSLKGRAWIDAETSQILAMESDMMRPAPEIRLFRDHQLIEYGPVSFRNKSLQLWLPKSADWYCSISGRRFHRRHTFSQFLLFSVDDKQKISAPPEPVASQPR